MFFEVVFEYFISGYDEALQHSTVIHIDESNDLVEVLNSVISKCNEIFEINNYQEPRIRSINLINE